jgi:glycosyltransferase 2 family protein
LKLKQGSSLKRELLKKRTLLPFAFSSSLVYLFMSRTSLGDIVRQVENVNPFFFFLAFASHYLSYLVRGYRWKKITEKAGFSGNSFGLAKMIFIFQSINCVLPAKLGDFYGAHLMKINYSLDWAFSLGSIFLWRIIDMVVALCIVLISGLVLFGNRMPHEISSAMELAGLCLFVLVAAVAAFLHSSNRFPLTWRSEKIRSRIDSFRKGLQLNGCALPLLLVTTAAIWLLEAGRFFFVCRSLGVEITLMSVIFISTCSALLTAIPLSPSGLGAVELGMVVLLAFAGVQSPSAYPLIMGDRLIAHWSQLLLGFIFVLWNRTICLGVSHPEEDKAPSLIPQAHK